MITRMDLHAAKQDIKVHSLANLPGEIGKLVYLAATRDYNTGKYYHDGLAVRFSEEIANKALAACHEETFRRLVSTSLEKLVEQLDAYVKSAHSIESEVIDAWQRLEIYRVTVPLACDSLSAQLFCSNLKIALAILESRASHPLSSQRSA
jgi:hypothetical protein